MTQRASFEPGDVFFDEISRLIEGSIHKAEEIFPITGKYSNQRNILSQICNQSCNMLTTGRCTRNILFLSEHTRRFGRGLHGLSQPKMGSAANTNGSKTPPEVSCVSSQPTIVPAAVETASGAGGGDCGDLTVTLLQELVRLSHQNVREFLMLRMRYKTATLDSELKLSVWLYIGSPAL